MIARSYGYDSWPKLKAYVDGVTAKRFSEAVRAGDLVHVRAMLKVRPELASGGMLDAVLNRSSEIVRVLMDHGANARAGMYPHRDATSPLTIATERGYDEIVAIISEEEQRRRAAQSGFADAPAPEALFQAIASGDDERAIAMMAASPALVRTTQPPYGLTPLHVAAKELNPRLVTWLLDRGADAKALARIPYNLAHDHTPLDLAAHWSGEASAEQFAAIASTLFQHGAGMTARAAVALGDAGWVRARHAQGVLVNPIEDSGLTCFRLVLERCDPNMRARHARRASRICHHAPRRGRAARHPRQPASRARRLAGHAGGDAWSSLRCCSTVARIRSRRTLNRGRRRSRGRRRWGTRSWFFF